MNKKRYLILLGVVLFFLGGCAGKEKVGLRSTNQLTSAANTGQGTKTKRLEAKIYVQGDQTVVSLPCPADQTIKTKMRGKHFELYFETKVRKAKLPMGFGLIEDIYYIPANGNYAELLKIDLKQSAQFLLFRDRTKDLLTISFVPVQEIKTKSIYSKKSRQIKKISFFKDEQGNLILQTDLTKSVDVIPLPSESEEMILAMPRVKVTPEYVKIFRLDKFHLPIKSVFFQNDHNKLKIILKTSAMIPFNVKKIDGKLALVFLTSMVANSSPDSQKRKNAISVDGVEFPASDMILPGMKKKYTGKKISIDLQDADLEHVLRLITSVTNYNLIIDDDVKGKISLKLYNIPWDQALDLVLAQKKLGMIVQGNIMRIATQKTLEEERNAIRKAREERLKAKESLKELEPLVREYIQINYTSAAELEPKVKEFLSKRGKITTDQRTNQLIVEDIPANIAKIKAIISKLDRPEKQVLIEARIIYATDDFKKALGIKWGANNPGEKYMDETLSKRYGISGMNYPASGGAPTLSLSGEVAKLMGKDLFTLDAEIKLAESQNLAKTISSPRIVTLNNQPAEITQGTKIAVPTESSSGGTTVQYQNAILKLKVTPHVTPDNKIVLDLDISDDAPVPGGRGDIETKTAKTKLIVNDGETIVIGGVRKVITTRAQDRVPGMYKIPILGWLFKNDSRYTQKQELLIFIRPKVLSE